MKPRNPWIELLGVIAHDLKLPMTAIKGYIELIQIGPLTDQQAQFADRALGSLTHMHQLVEMLLDVAWLDADKPLEVHQVAIGDVIHKSASMVETAASRKQIKIEVDVADDVGAVMGDHQRLPQIVNNLLNNAIKYNRDGGSIWITARGSSDHVQITVKDSGQGIPQDDLPHLFDPFFRSKDNKAAKIEGTGLGLAIVKGVVDKHGGTITVESAVDEGTTFVVRLPRHPVSAVQLPAAAESVDPAG